MRGPLAIRRGTREDALSLAPRLRPVDALEVSLLVGQENIGEALLDSVETSSEAYAAEEDGLCIALGGLSKWPEGDTTVGAPWLLGSIEVLKYPRKLVSVGREYVARWSSQCDVLMNYAYGENHVHLRWLEAIGFALMEAVPFGPSKAPFVQFYKVM